MGPPGKVTIKRGCNLSRTAKLNTKSEDRMRMQHENMLILKGFHSLKFLFISHLQPAGLEPATL
jgi:hypothetical protein